MTSIITVTRPIDTLTKNSISVPGSKYLANRLLIIATLAKGKSILHNLPQNQDIEIAGQGVEALGAKIVRNGNTWEVFGTGGKIKHPATVFTGENGTFSRFAVALAGLGSTPITLNSAPRMKDRPMKDILNALEDLGAKVEGEVFPLKITGPLIRGETSLKGNVSSQYFSGLALVLPYAQEMPNDNNVGVAHNSYNHASSIYIQSPVVSKNYLTMTINLMREFGVNAHLDSQTKKNSHATLIIPQGHYQSREYFLEADPVSATYFMALAVLSQQSLIINDYPTDSLQGEKNFPRLLEEMGCRVERVESGLWIHPPNDKLKGIVADMTHMPDAAPTLMIIAACAEGKTRINGISHLRHKESNRVEDMALELRKAGIKVKTGTQFMEIEGGNPCPALFDSHNDHRLVMSLSLLCLHSREVKIKNYLAVGKSFPEYFDKLQTLGFHINYHS